MGHFSSSTIVGRNKKFRMQQKLITMACLLAMSTAAPTAEAEADADAQFYGSYPTVPAPKCAPHMLRRSAPQKRFRRRRLNTSQSARILLTCSVTPQHPMLPLTWSNVRRRPIPVPVEVEHCHT